MTATTINQDVVLRTGKWYLIIIQGLTWERKKAPRRNREEAVGRKRERIVATAEKKEWNGMVWDGILGLMVPR